MPFGQFITKPVLLTRFLTRIWPGFLCLTFFFFTIGAIKALHNSPPDYQQGEAVRIMYVHVPAAWMALFIYGIMALCSFLFILIKNPIFFHMAKNAAPLGTGFTLICLITGSIWGKPIWGTWWVWDARLTSVLILLFLYCGYSAILLSFSDKERSAKFASLLCLFGAINLPIIKFSVDIWSTLHQPASIMRMKGIAIAPEMLHALLWMFGAFFSYFVAFWGLRLHTSFILLKKKRVAAF